MWRWTSTYCSLYRDPPVFIFHRLHRVIPRRRGIEVLPEHCQHHPATGKRVDLVVVEVGREHETVRAQIGLHRPRRVGAVAHRAGAGGALERGGDAVSKPVDGGLARPLTASTVTSGAQANRRAGALVMAKLLARDRGGAGAGTYRCPCTRSLAIIVSESTVISSPSICPSPRGCSGAPFCPVSSSAKAILTRERRPPRVQLGTANCMRTTSMCSTRSDAGRSGGG